MSTIESITLMLALVYSISLLYWSHNKWGAAITAAMLAAAMLVSLHWPLFIGLGVALVGLFTLKKFQPEIAQGQQRINLLRELIRHALALSMMLVAVQFAINAAMLKAGVDPILVRPDIGDAFLPIAGGIELKAAIGLGIFDNDHPAAAVMLVVVLLTGLLCKRAFCGWACPLGLAGDYLYKLRKRFIKEEFAPPAWLDWILRMVKYLFLIALLFIVITMPLASIPHYLDGYYHKVADLKMAYFFLSPGPIALFCFGLILFLALWKRQAFCRYICPYGALLGLISFLSPFKIRRSTEHCLINSKGMKCDKCTRACPANIIVHTQSTVRSDECQACMNCVAACPKKEALYFSTRSGIKMSARGLAIMLLILLFMIPLWAYVGGIWHSETPTELRMMLIQHLNKIGH
ncbi:4Fe-4S binding protein [Shewanella intestini]|uniref:4Fe-4S binding protein n=1 Tax=Shewanella intestini TaxID=2017544 RepID=A0ABS5I203_9GAMM|nr:MULTISPECIES: 4Fe-4S binding protein [Shewanella]MBR9728052.1 4Fe-4S binding protein [Shewanella intestini]MRG36396.1 4Fe-4S binding protein [Shewanella sp. XMDDZSB0408]